MTGAQVQDIDRLEWQHHALLLEAVELEEQASALAYHILVDGALWQSRNFTTRIQARSARAPDRVA